ncbi:hypothetical protein R6L23_01090 [Streptomyces sp. SR27]|uniref:hypothetical protein n=1 Tax=Streptomyces sp. SR27 TaxID=3076630 RepID=UPI00295B8309|nr:hypothetical protein [Streptomyces sp. SR27]MDV9186841.1 hypothetical protein [Streptomyces sp. SR27]
MVSWERDAWQRDGFESHEGVVGVLLADGSEPGPVFFDLGSGSNFHQSIDWWCYDGTMRRPMATSMRGRCACGWRGEKTYTICWEKVRGDDDPDAYDTSGPYGDWAAHMDEVAGRALLLPEDLSGLLAQVRARLDCLLLEEDQPVIVLKAADELEEIVASVAPTAVRLLTRGQEEPAPEIAQAFGMTEKAARARLIHYEYLDR